MNGDLYQQECLTRVLEFIDENYASRNDVIFWPDLAPCHYSKKNQEWMTENNLTFVPKEHNPPSAPQIRPIEAFWGILQWQLVN